MKNVTWTKAINMDLGILLVACVLLFTGSMGINMYKAVIATNSVESFEVERGDKSITCVTAWSGTQPTMSCLPTQWMEAEVVYDQADFQGSANEELVPTNEYEYPVCGKQIPPHAACWTEKGNLYPGYVAQ